MMFGNSLVLGFKNAKLNFFEENGLSAFLGFVKLDLF